MYLFANDSVLNFYPKFGFEQIEEHQYSTNAFTGADPLPLRKLRIPEDLEMIENFICRRVPVSNSFATANSAGITMYHVLNVFTDHLYYHAEADAILIEEIKKAGVYGTLWQAFCVFLPVKSVGIMGDFRTYEYLCAIRAVESLDAMTANLSKLD